MSKTTTTRCRYTVGQQVEVLTNDFDKPGFPEEWHAATVADVTQTGQLWDVGLRLRDKRDKNGDELWHRELVGRRGGNKRIRETAN